MVKELMLSMLKSAKDDLLSAFNAVPDDKINWKPLDKGRSALSLFAEPVYATGLFQKVAATRGEFKISPEVFQQAQQEWANWSKSDALAYLDGSFQELIATIEAMTDEELTAPVTMPINGGITDGLAGWIMGAQRAYISRFAQINYIQTLYGDLDVR